MIRKELFIECMDTFKKYNDYDAKFSFLRIENAKYSLDIEKKETEISERLQKN